MNDINLTLNRGWFVVHHILIFLFVLLFAERNHRTKEYGQRLLRNILLFQIVSEYLGPTLSHLICVLGIIYFKDFEALAGLRIVLNGLPLEFALLKDFLDFWVGFGCSVLGDMEQIKTDGTTVSIFPDEVKTEIKKLILEFNIYDGYVVEDHLDGVLTHDLS